MSKFRKTIQYDAYGIAGRIMEGVMFDVDITLNTEDGTTSAAPARAGKLTADWCRSLGGEHAIKYWCEKVDERFKDEDTRLEELSFSLNDAEYEKYESIILGEEI